MSHGFGDVLLLGLGVSTQAAGAYLTSLADGSVESVTAYAGACGEAARARGAELEGRGVRVVYGSELVEGAYDLGIVSPGVPATGAFFASAAAACRELVSEPELAWRESPRDWVAITGTNGKTTTTTLTCALLQAGGVAARTVGNIGLPPIACVADRPDGEVFVAELSSFQLQSCVRFAPRVAVLLNVTPDHVEWHGSLAAYAAAKERAFANLGPGDLALVGDDEACRGVATRLRARGVRTAVLGEQPCACASDGAWLDGDGVLRVRLGGREHALCRYADMALKGPHNLQNSLAAAAAALEMGADADGVRAGLLAFRPLAHRVEPCGTAGGISFFDDSKATNTDAVVKALGSFEPGRVVVMLGGHDKGTDLSELAAAVVARCRTAVVFGEAAGRFAAALEQARAAGEGGAAVLRAPHMREAFDAARAAALPGDAVLLSPACSSFDEFTGYAQRGDTFQGWVRALAADGGEGAGAR